MATSRGIDREREDALAKLVAIVGAAVIALYGVPQVLVAGVGVLAGAFCPSTFADPGDRRWWRATAWWLIGAGLAVGVAYFALFTVIGTDAPVAALRSQVGLRASGCLGGRRAPLGLASDRRGAGVRLGGCDDPLEDAMTGAMGFATAIGFVVAIVAAVGLVHHAVAGGVGRRRAREEGPSVMIGTAGRRRRPVALGLDELQQGVLIGGSPGAGKTTLLVALQSRLPGSIGCLFVDLKGDRSLPARLGISSQRVFGLGDRCSAAWNPLDRGNPAGWRDILMATQEWSEPHYRQAAARFVGICLATLSRANGSVELDDVIELLERPKRGLALLRTVDEADRGSLERSVAAIEAEPSLRSGVLGLGNRLALLRDSPATARRFGTAGGIDLESVLGGERAVFSLPAAEFPEEAPAIAAAVIQSFGAAGQRLARGDELLRAVLIVDEAARLSGQQLREGVAIGRGAGIGPAIAVQDHADLDYVAAGTREAVETGANTWIVMRQVASAEQIANSFGSRTVTRQTLQRDVHRPLFSDTGMRSEREVEEYRVSPNEIRRLGRGEAVLWRRLRGSLERIEISPADGPNDDYGRT